MKLTGTNSDVLKSIRQPTKLEESNSLVFIYPMIIDKYLERKWGLLLRDFFTTQFMAQIKISNVLNITSQASRHSITDGDAERIENAAERTAQSDTLGILTGKTQNQPDLSKQYYNQMAKHEYQDKVNQFRYFIQDQVKIDPRFADTRPIISNITVENLIDIPLIIGTKLSGVQSIPLFWILFFATGQYREDFDIDQIKDSEHPENIINTTRVLRMDRPQSFEYIKKFIKEVAGPKYQNYEQFLAKTLITPANTGPSNRISSMMHNVPTEIDRAIKVFMNATNERYYSDEIGFSRNPTISIENAYLSSTDLAASTRIRAQNLFTTFLANYVIPVTQSVIHTVVGVGEININMRLAELNEVLLSDFMATYNILDTHIKKTLMEQINIDSSEASLNQLGQIERMCEANSRLGVISILEQFKRLSFSLTSDRSDIINFIEQLSKISAQLQVFQTGLKANLISMTMENSKTRDELGSLGVGDGDKKIWQIFHKFFTEDKSDGPIVQTSNQNNQNPQNNRLLDFFGSANNDTYVKQISTSLGSITSFMAYYTFFSYLCEYIGEVKAKVEIQKKDALDFPNYCLVVRKEVIESLFGALSAANYKKEKEREDYEKQETHKTNTPNIVKAAVSKFNKMTGKEEIKPKKPINDFTSFHIYETEIMNMIRILNNRLNIPNIIVVDDKSDIIYYKWMYSGGTVLKLNYSTIQNYIQHQQEILPGY